MVCAISVLLCSSACHRGPDPNDIDPSRLSPTLLHDESALAQYLAAFPAKQYQVHSINDLGSFAVTIRAR
jgi:hypothetical protein